MKRMCIGMSLVILAGCAAVTEKQNPIMEVDEAEQVKDCQLLKTFTGPSSPRMWGVPYLGKFKSEVYKEAEKMGATHMLSRPEVEGIESKSIITVYKCPTEPEAPVNEQNNSD